MTSTITHVGEKELAHRWQISVRTLQRWRWAKQGPSFLKLGGRVVYRLADIEAWESSRLRDPAESASGADHA